MDVDVDAVSGWTGTEDRLDVVGGISGGAGDNTGSEAGGAGVRAGGAGDSVGGGTCEDVGDNICKGTGGADNNVREEAGGAGDNASDRMGCAVHKLVHQRHATDHENFRIRNYIDEQVLLGHMMGPYMKTQVKNVLGSHFRTLPLAVVEKADVAGSLRLIQNCSYEDEDGVSVNSIIDAKDFPTRWGTATRVVEE